MALILGTEYCKMDSNGRFKFPIVFKKQLATDDNRFFIRRGLTPECLELWTFESFQNEAELLRKHLSEYNKKDRFLKRMLLRVNPLELDSNDRLFIPQEFKPILGNAKEIVLQSTGKYIEIWERSAYDKMNDEAIDLESLVNERLGDLYDLPPAGDAE